MWCMALAEDATRGARGEETCHAGLFGWRKVAEEVGFEPTVPCGTTVFKTAAFNHSAIPPLF